MPKAKVTGATKVCPDCKRTLLSEGNFLGMSVIFRIKCGNCGVKWRFEITQETLIKVTKVLVLVVALCGGFQIEKKLQAKKLPSCNAFQTQETAQTLFDSDKEKYSYLDRDDDGVACEALLLD